MRLVAEDGNALWLGYGMNVHPGGDGASFLRAIDETVLPLRERLGVTGPFGLAVRFHAEAIANLMADDALRGRIADRLQDEALVPFTGNAFVMGAFHGGPLKDEVYRPPWSAASRVAYTLQFAELLALWCGTETEVSLSTMPGSWRGWRSDPGDSGAFAENLVATAAGLKRLHERTGVRVRLGLEPEPRCSIETSAEARAFFRGPLDHALEADPDCAMYLGLCYDVCHHAVMHEDAGAALAGLASDGVEIVKLQASNALEVADPSDPVARRALEAFDEPVYLHQVAAPDDHGVVHVAQDLGAALHDSSGRWAQRRPWRVHYHVPVYQQVDGQSADGRLGGGPLGSTGDALARAVQVVARERLTNHVEIETYTWNVLPVGKIPTRSGKLDLTSALELEFEHVLGLLRAEGLVPA